MADNALDSAKLASMTVIELRQELEKRGLEKSGLKVNLVKRLEQALAASTAAPGLQKCKKTINEENDPILKKESVKNEGSSGKVNADDLFVPEAGTNFVSPEDGEALSSSGNSTKGEQKYESANISANAYGGSVQLHFPGIAPKAEVIKPESGDEHAAKGNSQDLFEESKYKEELFQGTSETCNFDGKLAEVSASVPLEDNIDSSSFPSDEVCNKLQPNVTQHPSEDMKPALSIGAVDNNALKDIGLQLECKGEVIVGTSAVSLDAVIATKKCHTLSDAEADGRLETMSSDGLSSDVTKAETIEAMEATAVSNVNIDLGEAFKSDHHSPDKSSPSKSVSSEMESQSISDKPNEYEDKSADKDKGNSETQRLESSRPISRGESDSRHGVEKDDRKHDEKADLNRCLWVSGLSSITKASDLKNLFTPFGKVIGAKVVTSAKSPGSQCFGFVTMSCADEALKCIENLRKTTLHEKSITVEKAKTDPSAPSRAKSSSRKDTEKSKSTTSSSSRAHGSSSRSRHDDHHTQRSGRHSQADAKQPQVSKPVVIVLTETDTSSGARSSSVGDKITSSKSGSPVKVRDSERPARSDKSSNLIEKDSQLKASKSDVDKDKKDKEERDAAKGKDSSKSVEQLRKERAEKIEKEHKLREERRQKERERERQLREERRKEQEKREKERRERARKEAERVRLEREKQRELEKQREREREKERERFIRERKEREDRERKEREREREQMERERLEQERLERERVERERAEAERLERERRERDRLEKERLEREERELQLKRERERLELLRLERERIEHLEHERLVRESERRIDRGISASFLKRSAAPIDERSYYPDEKRAARSPPRVREDFFATTGAQRDSRTSIGGGAYIQDEKVNQKSDITYPMRSDRRDERSSDRRESRGSDRRDERISSGRDDRSLDKRDSRHVERRSVGSRDDSRLLLENRHDSRSDYRIDHRSDELRDGRKDRSRHDPDYERGRKSPGDLRRVVTDEQGRPVVTRERSPLRSTSDRDRYSREEDRYESSLRRSGLLERDWIDAPSSRAPKTLSDVLGRAGLTGILGSQAEELAPRVDAASGYGSRGDDHGLRSSGNPSRRDVEDRYGRPLLSHEASVKSSFQGVDLPGSKYQFLTAASAAVASAAVAAATKAVTQFSVMPERSHALLSLPSAIGQRGLASVLPSRLVPLTGAFVRPLQAVVQASPAAAALQAGYAAAAHGLAIHRAAQTQLRDSRMEFSAVRQAQPGLPIQPRRF